MDDPTRTTGYMVMRSVTEAARECGVSEATVRRWVADGDLPAVEIGGRPMVNAAEVAALRDRRGRSARSTGPGWTRVRALGTINLAAGLAGGLVFLGVSPSGLRESWWLGLCLASLLVGLALWRLPRTRRRRRPGH